MTRRESLALLGAAALAPLARAAVRNGQTVACNTYPWLTFARRAGEEFELHTDALLAAFRDCGFAGYEPIIESPQEFDALAPRLKAHGLEMRSLYVNSVLHDPERAESSVETVLAIARRVRRLGTRIIVTNPTPIRWGGDEDKSDAQLRLQAEGLGRLGRQLREMGMTLAYHNHDAELRRGAREFHHMLAGTDPEDVKFCLDAHWVYRGCGDSEVAVFDALRLYGDRVVELHLRQSVGGPWSEAFAIQGDIDYTRLFAWFAERGHRPHLVLEQAVEADSPKGLDAVTAHRKGRENVRWPQA